ncbi:MAG: 4Fe-4S ferredoxin [Elusimicrobia bacterium]|nr:4Fe-4S ferredoxin [Elusimicrobiota bacterium]MBD3412415.1 4Fe-4S ferredoxin [Elusimicrobiota bacterium]
MKTSICYFTGTGNSLYAARLLAEHVGDAELIPMARMVKTNQSSPSGDSVGFVFPVYCWGLPLLVRDCVEKLSVNPNTYYFGMVTYGGSPGKTLCQLDAILQKKGAEISAGFGLQMPGNYTPLYGAVAPAKQDTMFAKANQQIQSFSRIIQSKQKAPIHKSNIFVNLLFSDLLYNKFIHKMPASDVNFWADEKCNSCGTCVRVCPVDNVLMKDGKPSWQHNCQQCMACLQWCPQEAIQYGKKTGQRKRYHQASVVVEDIEAQKQ